MNTEQQECWSMKYPPSNIKLVAKWLHRRAVWDHSEWLKARTGSLWEGLTCNGCDKAFGRQTAAWYKTNQGINFVEYPDLQFYRFGQLCLECRYPYDGEGHFVVEEVQLRKVKDLEEHMEKFLPTALYGIVFDYYEKRTVPDYPTLVDVQRWRKIDYPVRGVSKHDALMSFPGVERVFHGGVYLDMRWFVPVECTGPPACTVFPCRCLSMTGQVENIRAKLGAAWPYGDGDELQAIMLVRIEGLPAYVVILTDIPNLYDGPSTRRVMV